jgi:thiol-disulfide isomerase/thioredoxin
MVEIINIENKNQLLAAKYTYEMIIFYVYGEKCEPCQILKPMLKELLENNDNYGIVVAMINYKTSKEMNEYFNLKKIPYLVFSKDSKFINTIQSSNIELVKPVIEKSFKIELIGKEEEKKDEEEDDFMDFDF